MGRAWEGSGLVVTILLWTCQQKETGRPEIEPACLGSVVCTSSRIDSRNWSPLLVIFILCYYGQLEPGKGLAFSNDQVA